MKHAPVISQEITQYVISVELNIDNIDIEPHQTDKHGYKIKNSKISSNTLIYSAIS